MALSTVDCLEAIAHHSEGLADAARGSLDAPVEHCPGWTIADLLWHVVDVHWFWRTIAGERLDAPPDESRRPPRPPDDELIGAFLEGSSQLVDVLRRADQAATCWTWAPQKDVAFVTRHQVQEIAVHHWDAVHATRRRDVTWSMSEAAAIDAVDEFLSFSVSTDAHPFREPPPTLDGTIWLCDCLDEGEDAPTWVITDGQAPGTIAWHHDDSNEEEFPGAEVGAHVDAAGTLLWLYGRLPHPGYDGGGDRVLLDRFRALCETD